MNTIYYRGYEVTKNSNMPGYKVTDNKTPYEFFKFVSTLDSAIALIDRIEDKKQHAQDL